MSPLRAVENTHTPISTSPENFSIAPIAPLADQAHKGEIAGIIQSLPGRLGGATGLYDTTLAAVQRVRETYDPEKVNSVLLITDGKNEDENGIDLDTLLAELAKMDDPTKPVPVIMIGFGPDTDLAAMQRIAQATKGAAYSASRPEDLGTLLAELAKIDDPTKPVPVIMIGFGPDTDLAAMQQSAQATNGAAYSASKPEDLSTVLVDALSQRTCRPNCG